MYTCINIYVYIYIYTCLYTYIHIYIIYTKAHEFVIQMMLYVFHTRYTSLSI